MSLNIHSLCCFVVFLCLISFVSGVPRGFTSFFTASQCPDSWYEIGTARGRLILSVIQPDQGGVTVGNSLNDREDPVHSHSFSVQFALPEKDIAADSCCDGQGACQKSYTITGNTQNSTSGVPFVQLILCTLNETNSDPVPFGTVAYFDPDTGSCPSGWSYYTEANGRFMIPGYQEKGVTVSDAPAFGSGQVINHDHTFSTSVSIDDVSYAGIAGCCNDALGESGTFPIQGDTDKQTSNVPYIQLLTCVCQAPTLQAQFPSEILLFNVVGCPGNWSTNLELAGRFPLALPQFGLPGATFGGNSLPAKYTGPAGSHTHNFQTSFSTSDCEVGLIAGCCADGYAKQNSYTINGVTDSADVDLPYLTIPACQLIN